MSNWGSIYIKTYWGVSSENGFGSSYYDYDEVYDFGLLAENGDNMVTEENDFIITG